MLLGRPRAFRPLALLLLTAPWLGCERVEERVVHRENCLVCHRPRNADGVPEGIEEAHPWYALSCTDCHGGQAWVCDGTQGTDAEGNPTCDGQWVYDKARAHVSPGDGPEYIKNLSSRELDEIDPAYLRFVNPGDLRIVEQTCAQAACHQDIAERVKRSTMAHTSGELTVARWRAGAQETPLGVHGSVAISDPDFAEAPACAVESLTPLAPPALDPGSGDPMRELTVAATQDQYLAKSCLRCHLWDFGENKFHADFRSSGCTACHMVYEDDGLSRSADPRINKETTPHPARHELTTIPPIQQCTHCHYRGGRIGMSIQGYRESAGRGLNPPNIEVLGIAQHGHDAAYYITDEDTTNDFDETPPDVHFEAGMHCVDCHTEMEVHGDGHLYADTQCAIETECESCHGDGERRARPGDHPSLYERNGRLYLRTKVGGKELEVPQVFDAVTPGNPRYTELAALTMGPMPSGFNHTQRVDCYTCHASWIPTCYGCHVTLDLSRPGRLQATGESTPGKPTGTRSWVTLHDLVLMWNSDGKLAPSMPTERFFMTVTGTDTPHGVHNRPRTFTFPDGRTIAAFGQRAFNPHTTRRRSVFSACDRCHSVGSADSPRNEVLLDLTHGFGTDRFLFEGCDVTNDETSCDPATDTTTYRLDAILDREGNPLVAVGHPEPQESRPLTLEEIQRMRAIVVDEDAPIRTEIPPDARTNPRWPFAQPVEAPASPRSGDTPPDADGGTDGGR